MLLEKFTQIIALLRDSRSVTARLLFLSDPRAKHQTILLQKLLNRIQTLVISLRADFIETVFPENPTQADDAAYSRGFIPGETFGALPDDRRREARDRRRLHTYLANDPRNGIADRRRKRPKPGCSLPGAVRKDG